MLWRLIYTAMQAPLYNMQSIVTGLNAWLNLSWQTGRHQAPDYQLLSEILALLWEYPELLLLKNFVWSEDLKQGWRLVNCLSALQLD